MRLADPAERDNRDKGLESINESRGMCALGFNRAGIDRIRANFSMAELDDLIDEGYTTPYTAQCNSMTEPRNETIALS